MHEWTAGCVQLSWVMGRLGWFFGVSIGLGVMGTRQECVGHALLKRGAGWWAASVQIWRWWLRYGLRLWFRSSYRPSFFNHWLEPSGAHSTTYPMRQCCSSCAWRCAMGWMAKKKSDVVAVTPINGVATRSCWTSKFITKSYPLASTRVVGACVPLKIVLSLSLNVCRTFGSMIPSLCLQNNEIVHCGCLKFTLPPVKQYPPCSIRCRSAQGWLNTLLPYMIKIWGASPRLSMSWYLYTIAYNLMWLTEIAAKCTFLP